MTTAIATVNNDGATLMNIIQQASTQPDFDVAKMQQLMELKREWDKDRAAEAYAVAIAMFQQKCPQIRKHRKPSSGPAYTYASYDDVMAVAAPILAECGIAVSFSTEQVDKSIRVACRLRVGTHYEDHTFTVPVPDMRVNDTQKFGAALSYAKRYALQGSLNIVVTDEDTDAANLNGGATITGQQVDELSMEIDRRKADPARFLAAFAIESLCDMPASRFEEAITQLRRKPLR